MESTFQLINFGSSIVGYSPFKLTIDPSNFNTISGQKIAKMKYIFGNGDVKTVVDDGITNPKDVSVETTYYLESPFPVRYEIKVEYYYFNNLIKSEGTIFVEVRSPNLLKTSELDNIGNFDNIHLLKIKSEGNNSFLFLESVSPNKIFMQKL